MIRKFKESDYHNLVPNQFSKTTETSFIYDDCWNKYTLENKGIKAIICFREQWDSEWAALLLVSEYFTAIDGKQIKDFLHDKAQSYFAKTLWTVSTKGLVMDKWHKFLGFANKTDVEAQGVKLDKWSMSWA